MIPSEKKKKTSINLALFSPALVFVILAGICSLHTSSIIIFDKKSSIIIFYLFIHSIRLAEVDG